MLRLVILRGVGAHSTVGIQDEADRAVEVLAGHRPLALVRDSVACECGCAWFVDEAPIARELKRVLRATCSDSGSCMGRTHRCNVGVVIEFFARVIDGQ